MQVVKCYCFFKPLFMFFFMFVHLQVNPSTTDWLFSAKINTPLFSGPDSFLAHALSTSCYPITFSPQTEGTIHVSILI